MRATTLPSASETAVRARLHRPSGIVESTRWLFALLAVVSLVVSLPGAFSAPHGATLMIVGFGAALTLTASWVCGYLRRGVPFGLDVLDAAALIAFGVACPDPMAVIGVVFSAVWFRALYGSTRRSLTRSFLYMSAIIGTLLLWPLLPEHGARPSAASVIGVFPLLLVTVVVASQLANGLRERDQSLRRDAALATAGSTLLGTTDPKLIRAIGWAALTQICAASAGMRLIMVARDIDLLRVRGASGGVPAVPAAFPDRILSDRGERNCRVIDKGPLDAAAGAPMEWACIGVADEADAWLLVGAPDKIPAEAFLAVSSLTNQVALALRNSEVHEELTVQASVDSLTGLANRASFTAELSTDLSRQSPTDDALHVLFLDLDDFKNVNDVLGHSAGDELLVEVAARLRRCLRSEDLCARLGGDEFAVVLRGTTDAEATDVARRMVESIAEPIHLSGRTARVGISVGIAAKTPGVDFEALIHQADVAMYAAKARGKGRSQRFHRGLVQGDTSRLSFEQQLAAAAQAGQLVVHYQPVLSLPELRCTAVEALVRWQHPDRGLLEPDAFIEIAERTGAIVDIGAFVLGRACADAVAWHRLHPAASLAMHVNVSARQLDDCMFIDTVFHSLAESALPASHLVLELTETVVLKSPKAIQRLKAVAARGIKIGIDDFGTGYSSLTTLRSLPVDVIKLDHTFIAGALGNPVDRAVIKAVVEMSSQLGLQAIAEGVERPEQQAFLDEIGADCVQGFLYLRPVPAAQLTTWLDGNLSGVDSKVVRLHPVRTG